MSGAPRTLAQVNALDAAGFAAALDGVYESSPWVAEAAAAARPFASVTALREVLQGAVLAAPPERQLALIRAHPDLAGRAAIAGELTAASTQEQAAAGLDRLAPEQHARFTALNEAYRERFGFPFVICVREHTVGSILEAFEARLAHDADRERAAALGEIAKIAALRLGDLVVPHGVAIAYGKAAVPVYRRRGDDLFACEVDVEVHGWNFLGSYTRGDNSQVVATDSMKNFVLRQSGAYAGETLEGLLAHLGLGLASTYPSMESLRLRARELRFDRVQGPLHRRSHDDHALAEVEVGRDDGAPALRSVAGGRTGVLLLKTHGSAFTRFVRDAYTTLPERVDRPLYVSLELRWRYADAQAALGGGHVDAAAVVAVCEQVFAELVSESIQQLVWEMGLAVLDRFGSLAELSFAARNLTRDPLGPAEDGVTLVDTDPFPAFGTIELTLRRDAWAG